MTLSVKHPRIPHLHDAVILLLTAFQGYKTEYEDHVTELLNRNNQLLEEKRRLEAELSQYRKTSYDVYMEQQQKLGAK